MVKENNQIFLSYSRSEATFALKLATDLRQREVDLWIDQLDIPTGERWDQAVEDALKKSNALMVILSPDAVSSNNVLDEISYALEENKKIIPVVHKSCKLPLRLRRLQFIDFEKGYDNAFSKLLVSLGKKIDEIGYQKSLADESLPISSKPQPQKGGFKNKLFAILIFIAVSIVGNILTTFLIRSLGIYDSIMAIIPSIVFLIIGFIFAIKQWSKKN